MGGDAPRKDQERLSALLEASGSVLKYRRFEDAARSIFDSCKKLIGATAGYVALLSRDGTENELLFLDSGGLPCTADPSLPMPIRGLRAEACHSAKTVYDNNFPGSEWVRFLPEGHAELHNVLFAPLTIEGKVAGLLGLANKPGGFAEDDARMAAAFGELAAIALHNSRTLEALENSEQRFRSLVESAADAIISADTRGNITLCNRRAEALFGYRAGEVVGKPLISIMPERLRDGHMKGMERLLSTGKPTIIGKTIELAGLRKDGSEFPLELSVAKSGAGEEIFFAAVIRDITERKRAEEALQNLATFPGENPNPIIRVAGNGTVIFANQSSRPLLKLWRCAEGASLPPEPYQQVESALTAGKPVTSETVCGDRTFLVICAPIAERDYVNIYGVDITERKRMEEALARQEMLLRYERDLLDTIMENTEAHLAYLDPQFNFIRVNSTYAKGSGHTVDELIGRNHFDLFPNEENQAIFEKVRDTGEPVRYIAKPFVFEDQPERGVTYWDWTLIPIKHDSGQVQGLVLSLLDVTERKRVEEELRERTHNLGERVKELNCLYGISRLIERPGISLEELLRETVEMIPPAWQYPEVACARIMQEEQEFRTGTFRESIWRQVSNIIVFGQRMGTVEVCYLDERPERDEGPFLKEERSLIDAIAQRLGRATERMRAEERIRAQGVFLRTVLDALSHPFYVIDANDYTIKMANAATAVGHSLGPTTCYELLHDSSEPCRGDENVCPLEVVRITKTPLMVEHTHSREDGSRRVVEVHCHPLFDAEGNVNQVIEYTIDVSERKRAEEALERLRSEFTGIVTHELKTPLTAIKGSAATALGSQRPLAAEENRELFEIIDEQADRLRELMDNLLDVTRIEAGTLSVSPEPTDLREVLEEARATFARGGGRHEVRLELPTDMPQVSADRRRIFQVLMNLLNNAAMFSPPGEPITIAVEHDPLQVTVDTRDRGQGIPKQKLPLLFKKFSRVHDDAGRKLSGTGLGLAICKGIVEAHGGRIWAESAGEGKGSTFSFTLPVVGDTAVKSLTDEARRAVHLGRVRRSGEKTRVLAVDDEPQVLRFLQRSLDEAGYQPIVTADPSDVAKLVELEEPDLVLLDLGLPGTSGFELLQRIREFSGVPVIFVTASDEEADTVRALKMGADDYITKPFSPSELLARIGVALRRRLLPDVTEARPPFVLGDLAINFVERLVSVRGQNVSLSATEYKILYALATNAGRPLTYDHILREVWGPEYSGETELVRSFIRNLRRKLGDDARNPRFILTERQVGYRMPKP